MQDATVTKNPEDPTVSTIALIYTRSNHVRLLFGDSRLDSEIPWLHVSRR
jgi:hypothetical protein